jgi:hypothetical protein
MRILYSSPLLSANNEEQFRHIRSGGGGEAVNIAVKVFTDSLNSNIGYVEVIDDIG